MIVIDNQKKERYFFTDLFAEALKFIQCFRTKAFFRGKSITPAILNWKKPGKAGYSIIKGGKGPQIQKEVERRNPV
jgi:hypothetical protein